MIKYSFLKLILLSITLFCTIQSFASGYYGTIFIDRNENGKLDAGEKGLPGVLVSDGLHVVKTDSKGSYTVETSPVHFENYIFFGASDGNLYLLDENTGKPVWQTSLGVPVPSTSSLSGNMLVVTDFLGNVYVFELKK